MARLVIFDGTSSKTLELTDAISVAKRAPENKILIDDKQSSLNYRTVAIHPTRKN
jgi:hypothetical protein